MGQQPPIDFEALFDAAPNPYVLMATDLTIVTMNDAYLKATMREREEIVGRAMFDAFPSDPRSESYRQLRGSLDKVIETGKRDEIALIRYDIQLPSGDYEERYWSATHTPLLADAGEVAFILQHTVDVTELHQLRTMAAAAGDSARDEVDVFRRAHAVQEANQSLAQETQLLRTFLDQAPGFVAVVTGPDNRFQMANQAYNQLVGHRDIIGKPVAEALPEVVEQGFVTLLEKVRTSGQPYVGHSVPVFLEATPGSPLQQRFLDFIYQPITSDTGEVSGIFVQGHDVTEQHQAQAALRESEERFRLVADRAPVMLWMSDSSGGCLYLNRAQREFWGVEDEDLSSFSWSETMHPDDREGILAQLQQALANQQALSVEGRYRRADGEWRTLSTTAHPRFDSSGKFLGMIGVNRDLTEERQAQAHQTLLINELNHRVKNTLAVVQGLAMQSFTDGADPVNARRTFDARLHALSAAHNLLTSQNWESAGLRDMIEVSVSATAGANAARVHLNGPDLQLAPQTAVSLAMAAHELCTNAIKYGALSNADGKVHVSWTADRDEDGLSIVTLDWIESGGPPVTKPARRGFGTRLIERGLSAELRSQVSLDFDPAGLRCRILARLPATTE